MGSGETGRKDHLFAGSQTDSRAADIAYTSTETAKRNRAGPQVWIAKVLGRFPDGKLPMLVGFLTWKAP